MSFIIRHKTFLFPKQHFSLFRNGAIPKSIQNTQNKALHQAVRGAGPAVARATERACVSRTQQRRGSRRRESLAPLRLAIRIRHEASVTGPLVRCFFRPQRRLVPRGGGPCALRHESGFAMASHTPGRPLNNTLEVGSALRPAFLGILL